MYIITVIVVINIIVLLIFAMLKFKAEYVLSATGSLPTVMCQLLTNKCCEIVKCSHYLVAIYTMTN